MSHKSNGMYPQTQTQAPLLTQTAAAFRELLKDVYAVLENADSETQVFQAEIPIKFKEKESAKILDSFDEFINRNPSFKSTTIAKKIASKEYSSFYQVYHDIKIAASTLIRIHKVGSGAYKNIDFFYKFATELLLRESSLYHTALFNFGKGHSSELEQAINNDFEKISYSYSTGNGEVLSYNSEMPDANAAHLPPSYLYGASSPTQHSTIRQPLFSSLTGKSELDSRLTVVPDSFSLAKVMPLPRGNGASSGATFASLELGVSKIPLPMNKPTTILDNFVHLTWYILSAPDWLNYKGKVLKPPVSSSLLKSQNGEGFRMVSINNESVRSFAPVYDSKGSGLPEFIKANVWLNQVGLKKIAQLRKEYLSKIGVETPDETGPAVVKSEPKEENIEDFDIEQEHEFIDDYDNSQAIKFENVLQWDPVNIGEVKLLHKEKENIVRSPQLLQRLISNGILRLNRLRQERYLKGDAVNSIPPSLKEKVLHKMVLRLIAFAIQSNDLQPSDIPIKVSKKIPVLTTEYSGTLPGIAQSKVKSARLPTIRGPYKKKNRII